MRLLTQDPGKRDRLLCLIAAALVAAIFTRYDGWVMALLAWASPLASPLRPPRSAARLAHFWLACVLVVAAPVAWFVYNAAAFGDWLYFAARPLLRQSHRDPHRQRPDFRRIPAGTIPGSRSSFSSKPRNWTPPPRHGATCFWCSACWALLWAWLTERRRAFAWALLLWLPVPFYAYSVAYGSVPIFLPVWWPHSFYNLRYGIELLPAFALALGFAAQFCLAAVREFKPRAIRRG